MLAYFTAQKIWLEITRLQVGDKVKIVREWHRHESGFPTPAILLYSDYIGRMFYVRQVWQDNKEHYNCIVLSKSGDGYASQVAPFFVLEIVK